MTSTVCDITPAFAFAVAVTTSESELVAVIGFVRELRRISDMLLRNVFTAL